MRIRNNKKSNINLLREKYNPEDSEIIYSPTDYFYPDDWSLLGKGYPRDILIRLYRNNFIWICIFGDRCKLNLDVDLPEYCNIKKISREEKTLYYLLINKWNKEIIHQLPELFRKLEYPLEVILDEDSWEEYWELHEGNEEDCWVSGTPSALPIFPEKE